MRTITLTAVFAVVSALAMPSRAAEDTFSVLKVTQGDEITLEALPVAGVGARQKELQAKAKEDHASWEAARDAFQRDKANARKTFRDPEPASITAKVDKAGFASKEEAAAYAEAQQKKADGKYAVVRITSTSGRPSCEILLQRKIKGKERELEDEYLTANDKWEAAKTAWYANKTKNPSNVGGFRDDQPEGQFQLTKPSKPKLERLKENLPDEAAAQKALDEIPNK